MKCEDLTTLISPKVWDDSRAHSDILSFDTIDPRIMSVLFWKTENEKQKLSFEKSVHRSNERMIKKYQSSILNDKNVDLKHISILTISQSLWIFASF